MNGFKPRRLHNEHELLSTADAIFFSLLWLLSVLLEIRFGDAIWDAFYSSGCNFSAIQMYIYCSKKNQMQEFS